MRPSRALAITAIRLGYIDAPPPVVVSFTGPLASSAATCTAVDAPCPLDVPFAMLPGAPAGSYNVSFTGTGPGIWDLEEVIAEARTVSPPS